MDSPILFLTVKREFFEDIILGNKKEEYREVKPYWKTRLSNILGRLEFERHKVCIRNGYQKDAPEVICDLRYITTGYGLKEWGADTVSESKVYIIGLGEILKMNNGAKHMHDQIFKGF